MTEEVTVNIPLLRKGLEWVEEQAALPLPRRRWNQGSYVMPWRHWLAGNLPIAEYEDAVKQPETLALLNCGTACCFAGYIAQEAEPGFTRFSIEYQNGHARDVATYHLGLTPSQASTLFNADNRAHHIRRICENIAGEPL